MPDETDVRDLLHQLSHAWSTGDPTAYANLFTTDADYVTYFGVNLAGRAGIEASHRALFSGPMRQSSTIGLENARIRFVRPDLLSPSPPAACHVRGATPRTQIWNLL